MSRKKLQLFSKLIALITFNKDFLLQKPDIITSSKAIFLTLHNAALLFHRAYYDHESINQSINTLIKTHNSCKNKIKQQLEKAPFINLKFDSSKRVKSCST